MGTIKKNKVVYSTNELKLAKKQMSVSATMQVQIMEKSENGLVFKKENKKFGFVRENRPIKDSDVNGFLQIIQNDKYDDTQSIVTVEASDLIGNYNIVNLEGNPILEEEAHEYLIVLDGQHRITAFSKLNSIRKPEDQILIPNVYIKKSLENIREYLADINTVGHSWNAADQICVSAIATGNKILNKINELIKEGYNASAAVQICNLGRRISPKEIKEILKTGDTSRLSNEEEALARANKFIITAMGIDGITLKMLTKRYFIQGFQSAIIFLGEEKALKALSNLKIIDFKMTKGENEFAERLKQALDLAAE